SPISRACASTPRLLPTWNRTSQRSNEPWQTQRRKPTREDDEGRAPCNEHWSFCSTMEVPSATCDTQFADVVKRTDAALVYRPILLGAVLKSTGNHSPMEVPAKGAYMA